MQIKIRTLLIALPLLAAACSEAPEWDAGAPAGTINVSVGAAQQVSIKPFTSMEDDGVTIKWTAGDKMAMWAMNSQGTATLEAHPFDMYHYNSSFDDAKFTANIPVMDEDTYKYYAVSPVPDAVNGTMASFDIPAVQDGQRTLACDVMVAAPVEGQALQKGDNSEVVSLKFSHKIHVLKIRIPGNEMGMPITALTLTFPVPVTGRMTVDATDPKVPAQLAETEEGKTLTLSFDEPKNIGDEVFAVIAPVELAPTDQIEIKAYSGRKVSYPTQMPGKNFQAAHTTPISLTIPAQHLVTYIMFSTNGDGTSTIGEKVEKITLTNTDGSVKYEFPADDKGEYKLTFEGTFDDKFSNQPFSLLFDTQHATVPLRFTMPQLTAEEINILDAFDTPYLLDEKFLSVQTASNNEMTEGSDPAAIWIPGLTGWSASRIGAKEGESIRIVGARKSQNKLISTTNTDYYARMDSAPLPLKAGANVKIRISFDYSGATTKGDPKLKYGVSTVQGLVSGSNKSLGTQGGDISANKDGSYVEINQHVTPFVINSATNVTRLTWMAYGSDTAGLFATDNYHYTIYIDNVKVSIVQ